MLKRLIGFLIFSLLLRKIDGLEILSCDNGLPPPIKVDIVNCESYPCPVYRNEDTGGNITFIVPYDMDEVKIKVKVSLGSLNVNYPMPDPNVCHTLLNGYCPLEENERITYNIKIPILKQYPKVKVNINLILTDPATGDFACNKLVGQVQDRPMDKIT